MIVESGICTHQKIKQWKTQRNAGSMNTLVIYMNTDKHHWEVAFLHGTVVLGISPISPKLLFKFKSGFG